ncbi:carbonic anhydrase [Aspergillus crustosus]
MSVSWEIAMHSYLGDRMPEYSRFYINQNTLLLALQNGPSLRVLSPPTLTKPYLPPPPPINPLTLLLNRNKAWATLTSLTNPSLFPCLAESQSPEILWIGCSDSRCPETTLLHAQRGDIFVQRDIANILHPDDGNAKAVIEYAVKNLEVEIVVLCGHVDCGGVEAVFQDEDESAGNEKGRELREKHREELDKLPIEKARVRLAELNVLRGVEELQKMEVVAEAMRDRGVRVWGVIYNVGNGWLRELVRA